MPSGAYSPALSKRPVADDGRCHGAAVSMLVPGSAGPRPVRRVAEVDVEPLVGDLVAAERVEHLAGDPGDEQDVVAVGVDVESGQVEGAGR